MLAVAHWLTDCGVTALSSRMEALAHAYQTERLDLELPDLTAWVIGHCASTPAVPVFDEG